MINRLQHLLGEPREVVSFTDFYELEALGDTYIVALGTVLAIERQLDQSATPDWLEFRDVFGARHRFPGALCVSDHREHTRDTGRATRLPKGDERRSD